MASDHLKPVDRSEWREYQRHMSNSLKELAANEIGTLIEAISHDLRETYNRRDQQRIETAISGSSVARRRETSER